MKTDTRYIIVNNDLHNNTDAVEVTRLLDDQYTLVVSWVVGNSIHHILSKDVPSEKGGDLT